MQTAENPLDRCIPSEKEATHFCAEFALGRLVKIHGDLGGTYNVNLKLETTGGLFVLRVHSGLASAAHVAYQDYILFQASTGHIPVVRPVSTVYNAKYSMYRNRIVQVLPYVPGKAFSHRKEQLYACGEMLSRFHTVLQDAASGPLPVWSNYPSDQVLERGLRKFSTLQPGIGRADLLRISRLYERVTDPWRSADKKLPQTVIHADWHPWNMIYTAQDNIKCLLDFDFVQRAERIYDLAYMLLVLQDQKDALVLSRSFLQGYGPLQAQEGIMLPLEIARAGLFFVCTASYTSDPVREAAVQLDKQERLIDLMLSEEGSGQIRDLLC